MGYMTDGLTFNTLREANLMRLPEFRDRKGRLCHIAKDDEPAGHDWALSQWSNAVCGELGELANLIKKIERGDMELHETRQDVAEELADVAIYLDLLAHRAGVNLGSAIIDKFNLVSHRVESTVWIDTDGAHRRT